MKRAHERLQLKRRRPSLPRFGIASKGKKANTSKHVGNKRLRATVCRESRRLIHAYGMVQMKRWFLKQHNAMRPLTTAGPGCMMQCARANTWASRGPSPFRRFFFAMNSWIQFAAHPCGDLPHRMHWLATTAKLSTDLLNPSVAWLWLHHRLGQACPSNVCVQRLRRRLHGKPLTYLCLLAAGSAACW